MNKPAWVLALTAAAAGASVSSAALAGSMPGDTRFTLTTDASRYYPDRAQRMEIGGWARLRCTAAGGGKVSDCVVVGEAPAAFGFGQAATVLITRAALLVEAVPAGQAIYLYAGFGVPGGGRSLSNTVKAPSRKVIEAARPAGAEAIGMAALSCEIPLEGSGGLKACEVLSEGAPGQGYGRAGVALALDAYKVALKPPPKDLDLWLYPAGPTPDRLGFVEGGYGLMLAAADEAPTGAARPSVSVKLTCGWTEQGQLVDCRAAPPPEGGAPALAAPDIAPEAVRAALDMSRRVRLARKVDFSINWGQ